jgi:hypothetical protein
MEADMNRLWNNFGQMIRLAVVGCCAPALLLFAGCRSDGSRELLERELRLQEDRIFRLEDELDDKCRQLDSAHRENQSLKQELRGDGGAGSSPAYKASPAMPARPTVPPEVVLPPLVEEPEALSPPESKADTSTPAGSLYRDEGDDENRGEAPPFGGDLPSLDEPAPQNDPQPAVDPEPLLPDEASPLPKSRLLLGGAMLQSFSQPAKPLTGDPNQIERLALNRQLTGGWNGDGFPGDEGVMVVFEPRDARNQPVEAIGDVSIVVLDPSRIGKAARIARWDFTSDEAAMRYSAGPIGRGFQFELPWASEVPSSRDLRVIVRVTPPDGRHVEADSGIRVTLPLEKDPNWKSKPATLKPANATPAPLKPAPRATVSAVPTPASEANRPEWSPQR